MSLIRRSLPILLTLVLALIVAALPHSIQAAPVSSTSANVVELGIDGYIGLDCDDQVNLGTLYGYGESLSTFNCAIVTNNPTGYNLSILGTHLINAPSQIDAIGATPGVLRRTGNGTAWGINATDTAPATDTNWLTSGILTTKSTPAAAIVGDQYVYAVGVSLGNLNTLKTGSYVGQLTLTATAI